MAIVAQRTSEFPKRFHQLHCVYMDHNRQSMTWSDRVLETKTVSYFKALYFIYTLLQTLSLTYIVVVGLLFLLPLKYNSCFL